MKTFLFLDIDGVLNSKESDARIPDGFIEWGSDPWAMSYYPRFPQGEKAFRRFQVDPEMVGNLQAICEALASQGELEVVLSSTWRINAEHRAWAMEFLAERGFTFPILRDTPQVFGLGNRGREISLFLQQEQTPYRVLILDDDYRARTAVTDSEEDYFTTGSCPGLFQTSGRTGLVGPNVVAEALSRVKEVLA